MPTDALKHACEQYLGEPLDGEHPLMQELRALERKCSGVLPDAIKAPYLRLRKVLYHGVPGDAAALVREIAQALGASVAADTRAAQILEEETQSRDENRTDFDGPPGGQRDPLVGVQAAQGEGA